MVRGAHPWGGGPRRQEGAFQYALVKKGLEQLKFLTWRSRNCQSSTTSAYKKRPPGVAGINKYVKLMDIIADPCVLIAAYVRVVSSFRLRRFAALCSLGGRGPKLYKAPEAPPNGPSGVSCRRSVKMTLAPFGGTGGLFRNKSEPLALYSGHFWSAFFRTFGPERRLRGALLERHPACLSQTQ